jgi:hypothetical protein
MKLTTSGLCVAAALAFAASVGAQTSTTTSSNRSDEISVTGCLARGATGGFVLNNARSASDMTRSGAATGTSGTTTTTSGTTTSGTTAGSMSSGGSTWALKGDSSELEKHVGHMIQVTGREDDHAAMSGSSTTTTTGSTTTSGTTSGTTGTAGAASPSSSSASRGVDVKSVKMISSSCS